MSWFLAQPQAMWGTAPLFLWTSDQYHYYLTDHLGTPQRLVRANGAVSWAARYEAFGRAEVVEDQVTNPLRFPGQYYDEETGTHYNFHRDYDPSIGRYLQSDPIGVAGGLNTYVYSNSDPYIYLDPWGLSPFVSNPYDRSVHPPTRNCSFVEDCVKWLRETLLQGPPQLDPPDPRDRERERKRRRMPKGKPGVIATFAARVAIRMFCEQMNECQCAFDCPEKPPFPDPYGMVNTEVECIDE